MTRAALPVLVLLLASLAPGCARRDEAERCPPGSDAAALVDPSLLAFLSLARSAHHKADLREEADDLAGAVAELDAVVRGPFPGPRELAPEIREVLADTRARLADLKTRQGAFDAAEQDILLGLEQVREPSYFRGHLFEVRGSLEEQRAQTLEKAGDAGAAKTAKARALEAYEEALKIQAGVIDRSLKRK